MEMYGQVLEMIYSWLNNKLLHRKMFDKGISVLSMLSVW